MYHFNKKKLTQFRISFYLWIKILNYFFSENFLAASPNPLTASSNSIGIIQIVVLDWSLERSLIDCKVLKCKAPGVFESIVAASTKFWADANSHSEVIILALFSLSAFTDSSLKISRNNNIFQFYWKYIYSPAIRFFINDSLNLLTSLFSLCK